MIVKFKVKCVGCYIGFILKIKKVIIIFIVDLKVIELFVVEVE